MPAPSSPRMLHVANGASTLRLIEAAGIAGLRSQWADPLHDGPVPGDLDDAALMGVRAQFLTGGEAHEAIDPLQDLRHWRAVIADAAAYDELVLWYEHDLFDQLNLVQVLAWIRRHVPAPPAASLICVGSFPGRPRFIGLGELTPGELGSLLPTRVPLRDEHYATADAAWLAFGGSSPEALDQFHRTPRPSLPFLCRALERFLQEYPWTRDGLSRSERRLLHLAGAGPVRLSALFAQMHDGEDSYYITDLTLLGLVHALSSASPPLLDVTGPAGKGMSLEHGAVAITEAGRAVLDRALDRVATCGLDRWLGGVHLAGTNGGWRWDADRGAVRFVER